MGKPGAWTGTLALVADPDPPHHGQTIRFTVDTNHPKPWVQLFCYQGDQLVAQGTESYYEPEEGRYTFGLYSSLWTSGAADCEARLCFWDGKGRDNFTEISRIAFGVLA